jgi:hypothetical protein
MGPSLICQVNPPPGTSCSSLYPYKRYDEAGNILQDTFLRLDHVVNIINVSGTQNGWVSIWNIPSCLIDNHIYSFGFNSAKPGSISANWDAIFESYIVP